MQRYIENTGLINSQIFFLSKYTLSENDTFLVKSRYFREVDISMCNLGSTVSRTFGDTCF